MLSIYHIARADFLERVRRYSFLILLGICAYIAYAIIPPAGATESGVALGDYRGLNNSAWIGTMGAVISSVYLFLVGFYLVNNAVKRDQDTRVGEIVAASRIGNYAYLAGKMLSNVAVLLSMVLVVEAVIFVAYLVKHETGSLEPDKLFLPLLINSVAPILLMAGLAVFCEAFHWLKRGVVNVIYYFLWIFLLMAPMEFFSDVDLRAPAGQMIDICGFATSYESFREELRAQDPEYKGSFSLNFPLLDRTEKTFLYEGSTLTSYPWVYRFVWLPAMLLLLVPAALAFHRFDPARSGRRKSKEIKPARGEPSRPEETPGIRAISFVDLPPAGRRFSLLRQVKAEMILLLRGRAMWWKLVTLGLFIATAFAPLAIAHQALLPTLLFFQVLVFSSMGSRELAHRTHEYVFAAAYPLRRQLPAAWLAGFAWALALSLPIMARCLVTGNLYGFWMPVLGAMAVTSLALFLGIFTGSGKFFEVLFTMIWYVLVNGTPALDFVGGHPESLQLGVPLYVLGVSLFCLSLSFFRRSRQIQAGLTG
jgi:hypothetical protein